MAALSEPERPIDLKKASRSVNHVSVPVIGSAVWIVIRSHQTSKATVTPAVTRVVNSVTKVVAGKWFSFTRNESALIVYLGGSDASAHVRPQYGSFVGARNDPNHRP
jgi:hypothetical protein